MVKLLLVLLLTPAFAEERRPSMFYDERAPVPGCVRGKLDMICTPGSGNRWIEFRKAEPRHEQNAVTVRFGGTSKESPEKAVVQFGKFANVALFIAAVLFTFIL